MAPALRARAKKIFPLKTLPVGKKIFLTRSADTPTGRKKFFPGWAIGLKTACASTYKHSQSKTTFVRALMCV